MLAAPTIEASSAMTTGQTWSNALFDAIVIGLIAFLTLVDLFAAQAILPMLATAYRVGPAAIGFAVNASTMGMAAGSLLVALFGRRINRKLGVCASLAVLAIPTSLLAIAPDLLTFTLLRITQGICMSTAFTLTLAYLGEQPSANNTAGAFAAYITGNVASNLVGRLMSAAVADHLGLATNFLVFAALNLAGASLVYTTIRQTPPIRISGMGKAFALGASLRPLGNRRLLAGFGIGFCILFAFIGTFSYINFVLVRQPLNLGMMSVGLVYFVFLPSIVTTPLAGRAAAAIGTRPALWTALGLALAGLPLLVLPHLPAVLVGLTIVAVGTFFAQAIATGCVSRAATGDRGTASGIYLTCYFLGGLAGSAVLGQVFVRFGWGTCVGGIGAVLLVAAVLTRGLLYTVVGDVREEHADGDAADPLFPQPIANAQLHPGGAGLQRHAAGADARDPVFGGGTRR
jgi:predicted MFS family arabinose efflux permease